MEKRINYLLNQFQADKITSIEKQELLNLVNTEKELVGEEIIPMIEQEEQLSAPVLIDNKWANVLQNVLNSDKPYKPKRRKLMPFLRWSAAAIILIVVSVTIYTKLINPIKNIHVFASDVAPGGNKAILTLADGRKISLTDATNGSIIEQSGISITKTADGQLVYTIIKSPGQGDGIKFNTISTPKGGEWQIHLPDGSVVWLNAASSLTYPLSFDSSKQRKVELDGEAYFEVAKDKSHPFIVRTSKQEVEVLGTHFNINSYDDEQMTKTTLLEGSIRISENGTINTKILKPGEQSVLTEAGLSIRNVDVEESVAWKNGYFMFINEKQESIMRKISRWYNVEIEYADQSAKDVMYYGTVSRFEKISQVLRKFEQTGEVRFEIKASKIIIHKD